jgi:hypothetical protein
MTCLCGCKQPATRDFLPGHDQRLRVQLEQQVGGILNLSRLITLNRAALHGEIDPWAFQAQLRRIFTSPE